LPGSAVFLIFDHESPIYKQKNIDKFYPFFSIAMFPRVGYTWSALITEKRHWGHWLSHHIFRTGKEF
jgi:hypothetical protein